LPLQGEQRIPYKMPEPWQVGHSRVGALVEVVIGSDHTLYLFKACESCKYPGCFAFFYRGVAGRKGSEPPTVTGSALDKLCLLTRRRPIQIFKDLLFPTAWAAAVLDPRLSAFIRVDPR
jgi:hypothetical protein